MFPYVATSAEISTERAKRDELPEMWQQMDEELHSRGAKFNTLCPIRSELHRKLFDELLRQITLECAEQG